MARVNISILGISELKWTRMGKLNSDNHYIYYCGQESLRRNGVAMMVNTEIRLIIFFAAKDGEALYSQQKQDQELTMAQIINSLLPNSDLN